jgi:hypothetical protein
MALSEPRYSANSDNTGRLITCDYPTTAYAATLAITPKHSRTTYQIALTGAMTVNATTTYSAPDDEITFLLSADGTARVTTFGTNFVSAGTLTAAINKNASAVFRFNGTSWIEISRFVQP